MKAILLHHAGGDKYVFRNLQQALLPEIESLSFELPGRGDRFSERFVVSLEDAVNNIYTQLTNENINDFIVVGNSMGAIIAFLLVHKLKQANHPLPKHLFLASRLSPDAYKQEPNIVGISSTDFWKVVQQYDGVPAQLLQHKELMEFYEPILRTDFELLQQFNESFESIAAIDVPASILFGDQDVRNVSNEKMQGWRKFFVNNIDIKSFEGKHFFLYENENVATYIKMKMNVVSR